MQNVMLHHYACLEYDLAITILQMVHLFESVLFNECAKWEANLSKLIQASVIIIQPVDLATESFEGLKQYL